MHFRLDVPPKIFGITSPISLQEPKPEDLIHSEKLIEALKPHGVFENEDELNHRQVEQNIEMVKLPTFS